MTGGVIVVSLDGIVLAAYIAKDVDADDDGQGSAAVKPRVVDHG